MITIAIADDHQVVRSGVISLLHKMKLFDVTIEACNGVELLTSLERTHTLPDICILDLQMPEMDGLKLSQ